jgi:hypothetical protein
MTKHKHSYVFYKKTKKITYYKCAAPNCLHFIDRDLIAGKESLCPNCGIHTLTLTPAALQRKRPLCIECSDTKESRSHKAARKLMTELFDEIPTAEETE